MLFSVAQLPTSSIQHISKKKHFPISFRQIVLIYFHIIKAKEGGFCWSIPFGPLTKLIFADPPWSTFFHA